ncbi:MAG: hypothetical protein SNH73_01545 [Rikenellaceae bacterium]
MSNTKTPGTEQPASSVLTSIEEIAYKSLQSLIENRDNPQHKALEDMISNIQTIANAAQSIATISPTHLSNLQNVFTWYASQTDTTPEDRASKIDTLFWLTGKIHHFALHSNAMLEVDTFCDALDNVMNQVEEDPERK